MASVAVHEEGGVVCMRKAKRIKKGLECCASPVTMCKECPYGIGQCTKVKEDALVYIEELEERVAIMTEGQPEVVRCKDCKHGERPPTFNYYPNLTWCNKYERSHDDDWFCADGERNDTK